MAERPGQGKVITNQLKASGTTDADGYFTLPNVDIDESLVPPVGTGDVLHDNPFGYVAVVGTNGVLHFKVEKDGATDFAWLDITEANVAYWSGHQAEAVFDRQLALGMPVQTQPPQDMAEPAAGAWTAWADGATASAAVRHRAEDCGRRCGPVRHRRRLRHLRPLSAGLQRPVGPVRRRAT